MNDFEIYHKTRDCYSYDMINYILSSNDVNLTKESVVADIGCGTGIISKQFVLNGNVVYAVDPSKEAIKVCDKELNKYKNYTGIVSSAEKTPILDKSVDFVVCAGSFHYFDLDLFKAECKRILKSKNSKILIIWDQKDFSEEIVRDMIRLYKTYDKDYKSRFGSVDEVHGSEIENRNNLEKLSEFFIKGFKLLTFKNVKQYSFEEFYNANLALKYIPIRPKNYSKFYQLINKEKFKQEVKEIFDKHNKNGLVFTTRNPQLYYGEIK